MNPRNILSALALLGMLGTCMYQVPAAIDYETKRGHRIAEPTLNDCADEPTLAGCAKLIARVRHELTKNEITIAGAEE